MVLCTSNVEDLCKYKAKIMLFANAALYQFSYSFRKTLGGVLHYFSKLV